MGGYLANAELEQRLLMSTSRVDSASVQVTVDVTKPPVLDSFPVLAVPKLQKNCTGTQEALNMLANKEHFFLGETSCESHMPHSNVLSQSSCVTIIKDLSRWHC